MSLLELEDAEIIRIAEPMMDGVISGLAQRNYRMHSQQFSVDLKNALSEDVFLETLTEREQAWGRPGTRHLIAIFRKPKSFTLVWNQKFDASEGEVMAVATIALKGGRYFVDYFQLL